MGRCSATLAADSSKVTSTAGSPLWQHTSSKEVHPRPDPARSRAARHQVYPATGQAAPGDLVLSQGSPVGAFYWTNRIVQVKFACTVLSMRSSPSQLRLPRGI